MVLPIGYFGKTRSKYIGGLSGKGFHIVIQFTLIRTCPAGQSNRIDPPKKDLKDSPGMARIDFSTKAQNVRCILDLMPREKFLKAYLEHKLENAAPAC